MFSMLAAYLLLSGGNVNLMSLRGKMSIDEWWLASIDVINMVVMSLNAQQAEN